MGDLDILHKTARSLILRLRSGLEKLERAEQVCELFTDRTIPHVAEMSRAQ